jgi:hypothetical protein
VPSALGNVGYDHVGYMTFFIGYGLLRWARDDFKGGEEGAGVFVCLSATMCCYHRVNIPYSQPNLLWRATHRDANYCSDTTHFNLVNAAMITTTEGPVALIILGVQDSILSKKPG